MHTIHFCKFCNSAGLKKKRYKGVECLKGPKSYSALRSTPGGPVLACQASKAGGNFTSKILSSPPPLGRVVFPLAFAPPLKLQEVKTNHTRKPSQPKYIPQPEENGERELGDCGQPRSHRKTVMTSTPALPSVSSK